MISDFGTLKFSVAYFLANKISSKFRIPDSQNREQVFMTFEHCVRGFIFHERLFTILSQYKEVYLGINDFVDLRLKIHFYLQEFRFNSQSCKPDIRRLG